MCIKIGGAKGVYFCYLMLVHVFSSLDCNYPMRCLASPKRGRLLALLESNNTLVCLLEPLIKPHLSCFDDDKHRKV